MTISTGSSQFKEDREQTDDSLITERGKTDESLSGSQKKTELKADEKVKSVRIESDEARALNRSESDSNSKNPSKHKLQEERHDEDDNIERERSQLDAVIRDERSQKKDLLDNSLSKERAETDENLSRERLNVDTEVEREITSHSNTKIELTSRDEFLAIVSHDLRNPIGSIVSGSNHLLEDPSFQIDHEMKYWLEFIKRNAETSLRLISDILDMERFAEGKLQMIITKFNLKQLIQESLSSFALLAAEKDIQLELLPSSIEIDVEGDRDRIDQVLSNLLGNALKFTPKGGSILIDIQNTKDGIRTSITDSGQGIDDDQKSRIFERFAQINNKDRHGLGLGLYISRMLIEAHQGKLGVISSVGKGSTFYFSLPN